MAPNETSALLKNYHDQKYASDCNSNKSGGYHAVDDNNHIVYVNKMTSECEPIFCLFEYTSSLTLDELLPYKFDPWWQNFRRFLLLTFWLSLLLTFLSACLLSYLHLSHTSCNMVEKQISTKSADLVTSASNSIFVSTTIANILSTELLGGK